MLREEIRFTDFNNQPSSTVEYFNLSKNEIIDLEGSVEGGLAAQMRAVEDNPTAKGVLDLLKVIAHAAYGIKSGDGKFFDKSPEITNRFIRSAFYDDFLFSLIENDAQKGLAFIQGVIPADLLDAAQRQLQTQQGGEVDRTFAPSAREQFAQRQGTADAFDVATTQTPRPVEQTPYYQQAQPIDADVTALKTQVNAEEMERFRKWQAEQEAVQATQAASAPASPDAFRVREEAPMQGLSRPPHEQMGDAQ